MTGSRWLPAAGTLALSLALATAATGRGQEQRPTLPTFGAGVEMVRLDVSVEISGSRFVTDLQDRDLEVLRGRPAPGRILVRAPGSCPSRWRSCWTPRSSIADRLSRGAGGGGGASWRTLGPRDEDQRDRVQRPRARAAGLHVGPATPCGARWAASPRAARQGEPHRRALYDAEDAARRNDRESELRRRRSWYSSRTARTPPRWSGRSRSWSWRAAARRPSTAIDLRPRAETGPTARRACCGCSATESGGEVHHPGLHPRPQRGLLAHRGGAEEPVRGRLRLVQPGPGRALAPDRDPGPGGRRDLRVRHRTGLLCLALALARCSSLSPCPVLSLRSTGVRGRVGDRPHAGRMRGRGPLRADHRPAAAPSPAPSSSSVPPRLGLVHGADDRPGGHVVGDGPARRRGWRGSSTGSRPPTPRRTSSPRRSTR